VFVHFPVDLEVFYLGHVKSLYTIQYNTVIFIHMLCLVTSLTFSKMSARVQDSLAERVFVCMSCVTEMYVHDIETKTTVSDDEPKILRETVATAHVDGMNVLGPVVGNFSMKLAIAKAKEVGIGFVVAKGRHI